MNKSHIEVEEHKRGARSRSNSQDNSDSCFIKLSGCGQASEQEVKDFFNGVEIEVILNSKIFNSFQAVGSNDSGVVILKCTNVKSAAAAMAYDMK